MNIRLNKWMTMLVVIILQVLILSFGYLAILLISSSNGVIMGTLTLLLTCIGFSKVDEMYRHL
jgi:purine-cytosine permease-like protein